MFVFSSSFYWTTMYTCKSASLFDNFTWSKLTATTINYKRKSDFIKSVLMKLCHYSPFLRNSSNPHKSSYFYYSSQRGTENLKSNN